VREDLRDEVRFLLPGAWILVASLRLTGCSAPQLDTLSAWQHRMAGHTVTYDGSWGFMSGPSAVWHIVERDGHIVSATPATTPRQSEEPFSLADAIRRADGADRVDLTATFDSLHFGVDPDTWTSDDEYGYTADHIVITP
jgi:hypothetical protein